MVNEFIKLSARQIIDGLKSREFSLKEVLQALRERINEVDSDIHALPTLCFDRIDQKPDLSTQLAGIPVAIKDLNDVSGVLCTNGSQIDKNRIPQGSDAMVERLEKRGASIYAKSNTPEFGSGGNTFNDVFESTRNPYDVNLTAGGSSGGAAAALASGTAWLAQGSDLAGSLRTPASFCGVTSLRPSPGLIMGDAGSQPFDVYSQSGPMARTIEDLALFADAMAGSHSKAGLLKHQSADLFRQAAARPVKPVTIAFSSNLGIAEISPEVENTFTQAMNKLEACNINLKQAHPDLSNCDLAFDIPRALGYAQGFGGELDRIRDLIKPENIWNIERGLAVSNEEIIASMNAQAELFNNASSFMQDFDCLICPAVVCEPFDVNERYPGHSDGLGYSEYYRWLKIVYSITATTLPVITIPCGKTVSGLPLGIQIIGKAHGEETLFSIAAYLEEVFEWNPLQRIQ